MTQKGDVILWINANLAYKGQGCLAWPFAKSGNGYGNLKVDGQNFVASNYICELAHGPAPDGLPHAAHSCGNGRFGCVAPNHLRWSTVSDNHADKVRHGTSRRGERPDAKLSVSDVIQIFEALRKGALQASLAEKFGVSITLISRIGNRKAWGWLTNSLRRANESSP